jgi:uncharacterized protein involved in exopolysaccharide biosynthesis
MKSIGRDGSSMVAEPSAVLASELAPDLGLRETSEDPTWEAARLLWERRRFLWRVVCWALLFSVAIAFLLPKRYTSTTRLMPPDSKPGAAMLAALATRSSPALAGYAGELLGVKNSGALFAELLRSRTVQDRIIERFHLQKVYWDRYMQDARKDLSKRTEISEERKSGVISIAVTDRSPQRAAEMAQAYVEELDRLVAQVSTSSARQERVFIEQRLKNVRADLDKAQREFSEFASKNTALDIKEQTRAMVESAATLQGHLIAAESELQGMEAIYTSENVRVRSLRARIGELQRQLRKLGGSDAALAAGSGPEGELYPSIRQLPLLGVEWADLYREIKVQETVYELLTQQYELTRIQEAKEIPVVHVVDAANIPEKKSFPPRLLIVAAITLLVCLVPAAWIVMSARWDEIGPRDPRKMLLSEIFDGWQGHTRSWKAKLNLEKAWPEAH